MRSAALFLLLSLTATAQPLRFGDPFPLPNTRYGTAIGAVKLVSTGDSLYAFWSTGAQVRMSKVVEGERRGGVAVLNLRPEPFVSTQHLPDAKAFDVVWTGTHFVVAGGAQLSGARFITTTAVTRDAVPFSPATTIVPSGYEPVLAWNGRTLLMLYTTLTPSSEFLTMAMPLTHAGRPAAIEPYQVGRGTGKALASNGSGFAGLMQANGESGGARLTIFDENGRTVRSLLLDRTKSASLAIAGNGAGYLALVTDGQVISAYRVDGGGSPLAPELVLDELPNIHTPSVTWSGSDWAAVYSESGSGLPALHTATIDAGGTAILARESVTGTSTGSTIAFNGAPLTAWWSNGQPSLAPPLYSALPLSGNTPRELTFKAADQTLLATASSGSAVLTVWREKSDNAVSLRAGVRTQNGAWRERILVPQGDGFDVHAASDGNGFAVFVWTSGRFPTMPVSLFQAFLLDENASLTGEPVTLSFWPEAVASNGKSYAFVGQKSGQLLSSTGALGPKVTISDTALIWPVLTSDGENFFYASAVDPNCGLITGLCFGAAGIRAARLGPNLERLDAADFVLVSGRDLDRPSAAWNGRDYVVAWTDYQTGLTAAMLPRTGSTLTSRTLSARTDLPVLDMTGVDGGVMLLVVDLSSETRYRTGLLFVDRSGTLTQRNTFNHTTSVTGAPKLALFDDGRLAYAISQFVDEAPQHGSSHVLLMLESPITRPSAPQLAAETDERTIRLNWTAAAGAVTGYRVEYKIGDGSWNEIERFFGPNERATTFRLNRTGERAAFRVRAWSDGGTGSYSPAVTVNATRRRAVR